MKRPAFTPHRSGFPLVRPTRALFYPLFSFPLSPQDDVTDRGGKRREEKRREEARTRARDELTTALAVTLAVQVAATLAKGPITAAAVIC
jgi:hypothetical protein